MANRIRPVHYIPNPEYPFRTMCGAGRQSLTAYGRARWRSVDTATDRSAVTCKRCRQLALIPKSK